MPVIAAVHGHALGGGIQIALGADIRIVHPDTQLSRARGALGARPRHDRHADALRGWSALDVAKELVFTARMFDGREAVALGLATTLSDDPHEDAMALAPRSPAAAPMPSGRQGAAQPACATRRGRAVRRRAARRSAR